MKRDDLEDSEMEKKDRIEILWEDMQGKFELVFEGHAALRSEMHSMREEFNGKHELALGLIRGLSTDLRAVQTDVAELRKDVSTLQTEVKENRTEIKKLDKKIDHVADELATHREDTKTQFKKLDKKIDHVADELAAHREDTETHRGYGYKVSES
jgi:chromosome segregation ATPase